MRRRKRQVKKPYIQYSKKLITAVMIFWAVIRLVSVLSALVNPDSATHMAEIVAGVDQIAMINCLAYTGNSVSEKIALGYFGSRKEQEESTDDTESIG